MIHPEQAIRLPDSETFQTQLFEQLFAQAEQIGADPIVLPNVESSYGLPILIGLRKVVNRVTEHHGIGWVFGLFEDRSSLREPVFLTDAQKAPWANQQFRNFTSQRIADPDFILKPVEPLGLFVLEDKTADDLVSFTSDYIGEGESIAITNLVRDPYFLTLSKISSTEALNVGFKQTFLDRRDAALKKIPGSIAHQFEGQRSVQTLNQRLHTRRGLGTLLLEQGVLLGRKLGKKNLHLIDLSHESAILVESYAVKNKLPRIKGAKDFVITL